MPDDPHDNSKDALSLFHILMAVALHCDPSLLDRVGIIICKQTHTLGAP